MVEGTVADYRRNSLQPGEWVEGRPKASIWSGRVKNEERFQVTAYRCTNCGYLKLYANELATSPGNFFR